MSFSLDLSILWNVATQFIGALIDVYLLPVGIGLGVGLVGLLASLIKRGFDAI